ncbi:MAG: DUF1588 domain-containing protein [Kiritimatiellia bacterium]
MPASCPPPTRSRRPDPPSAPRIAPLKPGCISCHEPMDPLGFALENFDPVGRWREAIDSLPVDASGALPDGRRDRRRRRTEGPLLERREAFLRNLASRLLGFGLGHKPRLPRPPRHRRPRPQGVEPPEGGSHLAVGIVTSDPFRLRNTTSATVSRHE